jgi:membrane-associated phospholipid phosphatase
MNEPIGWRARVRPEELLLGVYAVALVAIMATTGHWMFTNTMHVRFVAVFLVLAALVWTRSYVRERRRRERLDSLRAALPPAMTVVRDFLPFLIALVLYETLHDLTPLLRHDVVDARLIALDRALLGVDAAVWVDRFATPVLTQVMIFCYMSYFFAPALLAALLYWVGRRQLFRDLLVTLSVVTLFGYVGYLLVPAVGPYVFQAALFPTRLPGGTLSSQTLISAVDALKGSARDCFPSLHTAHTTVVLAFAWRFSRRLFTFYLPIALGLYVSTIYLRMHYAVDVAAGFAVAGAAVAIGPRLERWWHEKQTGAASFEAAPARRSLV